MKRFLSLLLAGCGLLALSACQQTTPHDYFAKAVLGSNLMVGFAGAGMHRDFASPSEKLTDEKTGATAPMTRAEVLQFKVDAVQKSYDGVKGLKPNDETKEMIAASLALHEFVLSGYRGEYTQLAALYDEGAAPDKIAAMEKSIAEKYASQFESLHSGLVSVGKNYAAKHGINVQ